MVHIRLTPEVLHKLPHHPGSFAALKFFLVLRDHLRSRLRHGHVQCFQARLRVLRVQAHRVTLYDLRICFGGALGELLDAMALLRLGHGVPGRHGADSPNLRFVGLSQQIKAFVRLAVERIFINHGTQPRNCRRVRFPQIVEPPYAEFALSQNLLDFEEPLLGLR